MFKFQIVWPAVALFAITAAIAPAATFIRVNQVGYLPSQSKSAVVMSDASQNSFTITDSTGKTVFSADISTKPQKWNAAFAFCRQIDFSQLKAAGTTQSTSVMPHNPCKLPRPKICIPL